MPRRKHLAGATAKQNRQYEHILRTELERGASLREAKRIAAATVRARANPSYTVEAIPKYTKTVSETVSAFTRGSAIRKVRGKVPGPKNIYRYSVEKNPDGTTKYFDLVIKKQAESTPKGWKYGIRYYKKGKGTQKLSGKDFLDLNTGYIYEKRERNTVRRRRRNVAAGFVDDMGVFHPIRASYDYDPGRAGESRKRKRTVKKRVKKTVKRAAARRTVKRAAPKRSVKRAAPRRAAKRTVKRRSNVAAGFVDDMGVFHPIRASYDYDPGRVGEGRKRKKSAKKRTKKASARRTVKRAAPKRKTVKRASRVVKSTKKATRRTSSARRRNPTRRGMRHEYSTARRATDTMGWRGRGRRRVAAERKRRRQSSAPRVYKKWNPSPAEIRREFAGAVSGERDLWFPHGTPQGLAKLGKLVSITTEEGTIKPVAGSAWLCSDTKGKLHLGSVNGAPLYDGPKRNFGEVSKVEYLDVKKHLGHTQPTIFFHHVGEEDGRRPTLHADGEGGLVFRGGAYRIGPRGLEN